LSDLFSLTMFRMKARNCESPHRQHLYICTSKASKLSTRESTHTDTQTKTETERDGGTCTCESADRDRRRRRRRQAETERETEERYLRECALVRVGDQL
jgi:hypothetical protein